jgi:16S rRNA (uracil1498-N3)-methyltransferase
MARRRFFVPQVRHGQAELTGEDAKHLTQVLRVEVGQIYEISDNEDVYLAEVALARKSQVVFEVRDRLPPPAEAPVPVTLLVALIRFERLETIIEKATELGAGTIQLVRAERSERGLDLAAPKRIARWQRIALEASQQSRRARLPVILEPVPFRKALEAKADYRLFLDEERNGRSLLDLVAAPGPAALLVGPEGGWPAHEREAALEAGWSPVSLGPLVLRTETAAIAALATLNAVFYRDGGASK